MNIPVTLTGSTVYRNIPNRYALAVSLAKNIRRLRRAAELTQQQLGDRFGIGQGGVSKWETGESEPDASELPKLALAIGASLDELLEGVTAQYDKTRDLSGHVRTGQQTPHQGGRADVPAEARVRELESRLAQFERLVPEIQSVLVRLTNVAAGEEVSATRGTATQGSSRRRKTG